MTILTIMRTLNRSSTPIQHSTNDDDVCNGVSSSSQAEQIDNQKPSSSSSSSPTQRESMALIAQQQRSLTRLVNRSLRRTTQKAAPPPTSSSSQRRSSNIDQRRRDSSNRDSLQNLDEATLHTLCAEVSILMGGNEETYHTSSTTSVSMENSMHSFGMDSCGYLSLDDDDKALLPSPTTDRKRTSEFDITQFSTLDNMNLQRAELERIEEEHNANVSAVAAAIAEEEEEYRTFIDHGENEEAAVLSNTRTEETSGDKNMIEVPSGVTMPLVDSHETWRAITTGQITVTKCPCCKEDLTCVDYCSVAICSDCWVFSPVNQHIATIPLEGDTGGCVGLGFKVAQVREWLLTHARLPCLSEHLD